MWSRTLDRIHTWWRSCGYINWRSWSVHSDTFPLKGKCAAHSNLSVSNTPNPLTCKFLEHLHIDKVWMSAVFQCPVRLLCSCQIHRYRCKMCPNPLRYMKVYNFYKNISVYISTQPFGNRIYLKKTLIRKDLSLFLFHIQMEISKTVEIITFTAGMKIIYVL